jgi:hypothetical protein
VPGFILIVGFGNPLAGTRLTYRFFFGKDLLEDSQAGDAGCNVEI